MRDDAYRNDVQIKEMMSSNIRRIKHFGCLLPRYVFLADNCVSGIIGAKVSNEEAIEFLSSSSHRM